MIHNSVNARSSGGVLLREEGDMRKLLMVFALATFALTGQDPAAPAPIVVAQFLGFSDAQGTQFQRLLQDFQTTFGPAAQQVMSAQQDLDRALESGEADPAVVGARLLSLRKLQKQLAAVVDSY